jgi:hypothetical protein
MNIIELLVFFCFFFSFHFSFSFFCYFSNCGGIGIGEVIFLLGFQFNFHVFLLHFLSFFLYCYNYDLGCVLLI